MNNRITLCNVKKRLEEQAFDYEVLMLQDDFSILCSGRGGRIFGPFESEDSESVFWVNKAFRYSEAFAGFIRDEEWNMGGDRIWIAPEIPFFVKDRAAGFDSFIVQKHLDPGNYDLCRRADSIILDQDVILDVYQNACTKKEFHLKKTICKSDNPLRNLPVFEELSSKVKFCGFEQIIELADNSEDCDLYLENWILTQVNTPGILIVPFLGRMEFVDYFEPVEKQDFYIRDNYMEINVTGDRRYKLGFKSVISTGRSGYLSKLSDGRSYLIIRSFINNPSSLYCCEPFDKPGQTGCSSFIYNDSGALGGYAEMENLGITISGDTGKKCSADVVYNWLYIGEETALKQIANTLLEIKLIKYN
ncbi:MAG: DUF6786 family protein [Eubacteriales bacterium]